MDSSNATSPKLVPWLALHNEMQDEESISEQKRAELLTESFVSSLEHAADAGVGRKLMRNGTKPGMTKEVADLMRLRRFTRATLDLANSTSQKSTIQEALEVH